MKLIALDVGTKRIGVAKADSSVRIAVPYPAVEVEDGAEFQKLLHWRELGTSIVLSWGCHAIVKARKLSRAAMCVSLLRSSSVLSLMLKFVSR